MRHIRPTKVVRAVVPAGLRPASGLLRAGWQADYQYDGMGNRTVMHYGGNSVGGQRRTVTCGADADNLNRYPSITFGSTTDVADVTGLADSQTAAEALRLNINGAGYTTAPTQVQGGYYDFKVGFPSYAWVNKGAKLAFNLGKPNPNYPGYYDSLDYGKLVLPPTSAFLFYDEDGNLTSDGVWKYSWDVEGRLTCMEQDSSNNHIVNSSYSYMPYWLKIEFAYDWMGRRIGKKVTQKPYYNSTWTLVRNERFIYDGWNLVATLRQTSSTELAASFVWGNDLSRSEQGAGGVGGLLFARFYPANNYSGIPPTLVYYGYDGNGNVTTLYNPASQSVAAVYEYDAFGQILRQTGPTAAANPFRFSTKFTDDESGLNYYGYRYYSPWMVRWISRDPIGERGGINLYAMVGNDVVNKRDVLGLCKEIDLCFGVDTSISDPKSAWPKMMAQTKKLQENLNKCQEKCCTKCVSVIAMLPEKHTGTAPADGKYDFPADAALRAQNIKNACQGGGLGGREVGINMTNSALPGSAIATGDFGSPGILFGPRSASSSVLSHELGHNAGASYPENTKDPYHSPNKDLMYFQDIGKEPDCEWCKKMEAFAK